MQMNSRASLTCTGFWEAGSLSTDEKSNPLLTPSHGHGAQGWRSRAAVVEKCWRKGGRAEGGG